MIFGLLFALGTALTTGVGSVLQAMAARRAPGLDATAGDSAAGGSIGRLVVSPLYLAGLALDGLGFLCIVAALHWLPLFLVQCASASSVGVTAVVGRRLLGTNLDRNSVLALTGLGVGLVLLAAGAKPEAALVVNRHAQWWLVLSAVPVIAAGAAALGGGSDRAGGILATIGGLAFAGLGVASRILSDAHSVHDVLIAPASYALVVLGVAGTVFFAASLQRIAVTTATAALFGVETLAASTIGLLVLGDSTRRGFVVPTAIGFVVTLASALRLALIGDVEPDVGPQITARATAPGR